MITPRVDLHHDNHGFIHDWISTLASKVDNLTVITLNTGLMDLPDNVQIHSLEGESNRITKFLHLNHLLLRIVPQVDGVFTNMFPEFPLYAAPYTILFRKILVMWHTHGTITRQLRLALRVVDHAVTASKESLRLSSPKVHIIGHGINTEKFKPGNKEEHSSIVILTISRIDKVKNLEAIVDVLDVLVHDRGKNASLRIVGAPCIKDDYLPNLKEYISSKALNERVTFVGAVPYIQIEKEYQTGDVFINTSLTGSVDKTVLEAIACGLPVLTSNQAFSDILPPENRIPSNEPSVIADTVEKVVRTSGATNSALAERVLEEHSLDNLFDQLLKLYR